VEYPGLVGPWSVPRLLLDAPRDFDETLRQRCSPMQAEKWWRRRASNPITRNQPTG